MSAGLRSWVTGWHWRERILNFTPSWFMVCMGTGTCTQILVNFPYPYTGGTYWMRNLGYCFWVLDILLFALFTSFLITRYIRHPILMKKTITEFPNSSYLGAIPIALNTIIVGLVSYYNYRDSAVWAAFVLYWISIVLTLAVGFGLLIIQMTKQEEHSISDVAGLWLMTAVPMIVTSAVGANMLPYLQLISPKVAMLALVASFLLWSLGLVLVHLILACYFWRLISYKLPPNQLLASGFLPLAPLGQSALAAQQFSIYLSNYLRNSGYAPTQSQLPPVSDTVLLSTGMAIHWLGIITSLFLLAHATFWLVQATASVLIRMPKKFNIGMWSFTFPLGSYANAWSYLSRDLHNEGMRGWAATTTVAVLLIWLFCATMTAYLGFWKGDLFSAPGLENWVSKEVHDDDEDDGGRQQGGGKRYHYNGTYAISRPGIPDEEDGREGVNANANGQSTSTEQNGSANKRQNGSNSSPS